MNGLAEYKPAAGLTLGERVAYIKGLCDQATASGLGGGHAGKQLFDTLDYMKLAKYSHATNDGVCDGEGLTEGAINDAIIEAIIEQSPYRKRGGLSLGLITTNNIIFQFYLIKTGRRISL